MTTTPKLSEVNIDYREREVAGMVFWPEVATDLYRKAVPIQLRARAIAPQRTGALRRGIVLQRGADANGNYVDVVSTVRAPDGFPYGVAVNKRRPYLRPALRVSI